MSPITGCKKKLYALAPSLPPRYVPTQRTRQKVRSEPADPLSLERGVRQLLADRISGNQVGIWLLIPEHLRLGTWDLLCSWAGGSPQSLEPRLALHLIHEAGLCLRDLRHQRSLAQKGFEVASGLPFVPTDQALHDLLEARSIADSEQLQIALGQLRRASHHFRGQRLIVDPHRLRSFSRRHMRRRRGSAHEPPEKVTQAFFCLDAQTQQPLCFTLNSSAPELTQTTPHLLDMAAAILPPGSRPQVMADKEHFAAELVEAVIRQGQFQLLLAMPQQPALRRQWQALPESSFQTHWPGYALAKTPYHFAHSAATGFQFLQRTTVRGPSQYQGFFSTDDRPPEPEVTVHYPQRWHVEEFFKFHQALGWERAGTLNLNVRYGQMTLALVAQALIHQVRQRLGAPYASWDASHMARQLFEGLDGAVQVCADTILVTYYNAPPALRQAYENLEEKLAAEGISNTIPWLYNFKLNFRFK